MDVKTLLVCTFSVYLQASGLIYQGQVFGRLDVQVQMCAGAFLEGKGRVIRALNHTWARQSVKLRHACKVEIYKYM